MNKLKQMPFNLEAESFLISALLIDQRSFDRIFDKKISPEDFYDKRHENIFRAFIELTKKNHPIDIITLTEELQKNNLLDITGGASYITSLMDKFPTTANIAYYADIVKNKSLLRQLIFTSNIIIEKCMNDEFEAKDLIEDAEKSIFAINDNNNPNQLKDVKIVVRETMNQIMNMMKGDGELPGVPSGFPGLDDLTNGFQKEQLIVIAARPAVGKTAFALNIATNAAIKYKKRIGFFSCEMSANSLMRRMLCSYAEVDQQLLLKNIISNRDKKALVDASARLYDDVELIIDDTPSIPLFDLISKARRMKREKNIDILIIDYLQLISVNQGNDYFKPKHEQVALISKSLKDLARQLQIPVIALAQLNRNVDTRDDTRPKLSDLKDSGAIEQDADLILFIYKKNKKKENENDEEKNEKDSENSNTERRNISIGKNRNGPTGEREFIFLKNYTKFVTYTKSDY